MLENILLSWKRTILGAGLALSLYACGDTNIIVNNYVGRDGGNSDDISQVTDASIEQDTSRKEVGYQQNNLDSGINDNELKKSSREDASFTYQNVDLILNDVNINWLTTWGKITDLDLSIQNGEAITINPTYVLMNVEGYDDIDKVVPIPSEGTNISSAETYSGRAEVPRGFAYNQVTVGDLHNVEINLRLFDGLDRLMSSYVGEFNLCGDDGISCEMLPP